MCSYGQFGGLLVLADRQICRLCVNKWICMTLSTGHIWIWHTYIPMWLVSGHWIILPTVELNKLCKVKRFCTCETIFAKLFLQLQSWCFWIWKCQNGENSFPVSHRSPSDALYWHKFLEEVVWNCCESVLFPRVLNSPEIEHWCWKSRE